MHPALNYFFADDVSLNQLKEKFIQDIVEPLSDELEKQYQINLKLFEDECKQLKEDQNNKMLIEQQQLLDNQDNNDADQSMDHSF